jgi:hypothetical protein
MMMMIDHVNCRISRLPTATSVLHDHSPCLDLCAILPSPGYIASYLEFKSSRFFHEFHRFGYKVPPPQQLVHPHPHLHSPPQLVPFLCVGRAPKQKVLNCFGASVLTLRTHWGFLQAVPYSSLHAVRISILSADLRVRWRFL